MAGTGVQRTLNVIDSTTFTFSITTSDAANRAVLTVPLTGMTRVSQPRGLHAQSGVVTITLPSASTPTASVFPTASSSTTHPKRP